MLSFLRERFSKIFQKPKEKVLEEMEVALLEAGVALEVVDLVIEKIKEAQDPKSKLREVLLEIMKKGKIEVNSKPYKIMICGINGTGKTTTVAKLAHYFLRMKKSVVVAASDTFRAAAIEQLEEHCKNLGIKLIKHKYGADPAAVAFDAVKHAKARGIDIVLIDTAGRLHVDTGLMRELEKIRRVIRPELSLLTLDATTGNDAVEQARAFNELIDGFVITKFDVDERGGALISVSAVTGKPIFFLGTGQRYEDLVEFDPQDIVKRLGL